MLQGTHSPFLGPAEPAGSLLGPSGEKGTSVDAAQVVVKSGAPTAGASVGVKPARAKRQFLALNAPEEI